MEESESENACIRVMLRLFFIKSASKSFDFNGVSLMGCHDVNKTIKCVRSSY